MVLGITGISGSGKHTAGDFLKQKGFVILDADKIAHYLYRPYTSVWKGIVDHFGEEILSSDDRIDRQKLGKIVFGAGSPGKTAGNLAILNQITHPAVIHYIKDELYHVRNKPNVAVIVSLWEELKLRELCEKILLVKADKKLTLDRVLRRDGISEDMYGMRIKNQMEPPNPDFTIVNEGDFQELYKKLNELPFLKM
jgi:dephospho-CoA kinase